MSIFSNSLKFVLITNILVLIPISFIAQAQDALVQKPSDLEREILRQEEEEPRWRNRYSPPPSDIMIPPMSIPSPHYIPGLINPTETNAETNISIDCYEIEEDLSNFYHEEILKTLTSEEEENSYRANHPENCIDQLEYRQSIFWEIRTK